jgi:hypothetical protein
MSLRGLETAIFSRGYQFKWEWIPPKVRSGDPEYRRRLLHLVGANGEIKHTLEYPFKEKGSHSRESEYYGHCKVKLLQMAEELIRGEPVIGGIPG